MNLLMLSWVAASLPRPYHQAILCSAGSDGYCAFRRSLQPGYPAHTILMTNIEEEDVCGEPLVIAVGTPNTNDINMHEGTFLPPPRVKKFWNSWKSKRTVARSIPKREEPFMFIFRVTWPTYELPIVLSTFTRTTTHLSLVSGNVKVLPAMFLQNCGDLKTLDLSPLTNIHALSTNFLANCRGLTCFDLTPLRNVTVLPFLFMSACSGLSSIDLTPLSSVTSIESGFMRSCTGLLKIDLSPVARITVVASNFLSGCTGLTVLDLSPLINVTKVHATVGDGCAGVKKNNGYVPPVKVADIPLYFS